MVNCISTITISSISWVCLLLSSFFGRNSHPSSVIHSKVLNIKTVDNVVFKFEVFLICIHSSFFVFGELNWVVHLVPSLEDCSTSSIPTIVTCVAATTSSFHNGASTW